MTRKKVKLAFITNDSIRKATYKKRKCGLLKKIDQLTILCDVKACAILYSPYETKPVVWPRPSETRAVIERFKQLPEMKKVHKMVNQEELLRQRVAKVREQLERLQRDNREKEMTRVMYECLNGNKAIQNLSVIELRDLGLVINENLVEIDKRIEKFRKEIPTPSFNNTNHFIDYNMELVSRPSLAEIHYASDCSNSGLPPFQQAVGLGFGCEGLQENRTNVEAKQKEIMKQPLSSFMDITSPITALDHQQTTIRARKWVKWWNNWC